MIKFIVEEALAEENESLTLADVEEDQFFVNDDDSLCQKVTEASYYVIADINGSPCAYEVWRERDTPIKRILPKVTRIEF
jgi:hypothetical protein